MELIVMGSLETDTYRGTVAWSFFAMFFYLHS